MTITPAEQLFLELANRARLDPLAEAARFGIDLNDGVASDKQINGSAKQVLVHNSLLETAAERHSDWMLEKDIFSHTGEGGSAVKDRLAAAGYIIDERAAWARGENLSFAGATGPIDLNALVVQQHEALFRSAGHRINTVNGSYRETGIAQVEGVFTQNNTHFNTSMITETFALSGTQVFVTGVVYTDQNRDNFYSVGEAVSGQALSVNGVQGKTEAAGGYGQKLNAADKVSVTFGASIEVLADLRRGNVKIDLVDGNRVFTSGNLTLVSGVAEARLLGVEGLSLTGSQRAEMLIGNRGDNLLIGGGGNDTLDGGEGNDTLVAALAGDQLILGGAGTDTVLFDFDRSAVVVSGNLTELVLKSASGTITLRGAEIFQFRDRSFSLQDLLSSPNAPVVVPPEIKPPVIVGPTEGNDRLEGTAGPDRIDALGGNDSVWGFAGDDTLIGGAGNDLLYGGDGRDSLDGGIGNDSLYGGTGNDTLMAGDGDDYMNGGIGADLIYLGAGNDKFEDTTDNGALGADTIYGGDGNDWIHAGGGPDVVYGDAGRDTIYGGTGHDKIYGGTDNDNLYGGLGNDSLYGGSGNDRIEGGDGDDYVNGGLGADTVYLGTGNDKFEDTTDNGALGADTIYGGDGHDWIHAGGGPDVVFGDAGNDTIYGGTGHDKIYGGLGADFLNGGLGNDSVYGGDGRDLAYLGDGDDRYEDTAQAASDTVYGGNGNDWIDGGGGDDWLYGDVGYDTLYGGAGNDSLYGGNGLDQLYGGDGNDLLYGGNGHDTLTGGAGADTFVFRSGETGANRITDFTLGEDLLQLAPSLWSGSLDAASVVAQFAKVTDLGVQFTFSGQSVLLEGLFSTQDLDQHITLL